MMKMTCILGRRKAVVLADAYFSTFSINIVLRRFNKKTKAYAPEIFCEFKYSQLTFLYFNRHSTIFS